MVICESVALISPEARAPAYFDKVANGDENDLPYTYYLTVCLHICKCAVLEKAISNILQPAGLLTHYLHNIIAKAQFSEV